MNTDKKTRQTPLRVNPKRVAHCEADKLRELVSDHVDRAGNFGEREQLAGEEPVGKTKIN